MASRSFAQRVAEYVDSPRMRDRRRFGERLFATIDGNYGVYETEAVVRKGKLVEGWCLCPSENDPCKHVAALVKTWKVRPETFLDLGPRWRKLEAKPKRELLKLLREIGEAYPQALEYMLGLSEEIAQPEPWEQWE